MWYDESACRVSPMRIAALDPAFLPRQLAILGAGHRSVREH